MILKELLYEGKAKAVYLTDPENEILAVFKDSLTAFNNKKKDTQVGKGSLNANISAILFRFLEANSVKTHFINQENDNTLRIKKLNMIPVEVVIRNISAGSIVKRYKIKKGMVFDPPILEYYYKNDDLDDPLMNEHHINVLNLLNNQSDINSIKSLALSINQLLKDFFNAAHINLVDLKLEFGYDNKSNILLADELSPDNMRLWDKITGSSFDKDIFRNESGDLLPAYKEVFNRIKNIKHFEMPLKEYKAEIFISLRKDIKDPEAITVLKALHELDFTEMQELKTTRTIKIKLKTLSYSKAHIILKSACQKLLANPVIEDYNIKVR